MKIKAEIDVDVPMGLFCKSCLRKERDEKHRMFCTLFNRFIYVRKGDIWELFNVLYLLVIAEVENARVIQLQKWTEVRVINERFN